MCVEELNNFNGVRIIGENTEANICDIGILQSTHTQPEYFEFIYNI